MTGPVTFTTQTDTTAATSYGSLLSVCEPGGKVRTYRGAIRAVNGTDGENRTVNEVPLEQYLRAVVAKDSGVPLPRLGTVALRDRLLQVPDVREARVTRDWPHGITVQLVAREPVAAVPEKHAPAGATAPGFALLDEEGVQVGRAEAAPPGLPVVDVPADDPRTLQAVLGVLRQLPGALLSEVAGVAAQTQDTVTMHLRDGVEVDWGSSQETQLKIAVLTALRASPTAKGAHVYDVSAPRLPITR